MNDFEIVLFPISNFKKKAVSVLNNILHDFAIKCKLFEDLG